MNMKEILDVMVKKKASDLHLRAGYPPVIRIDGELTRLGDIKLMPDDVKKLAAAIMNKQQRETFEKDNEVDFAFGISGLGRFRTNVYVQRGTLALAIRAINSKVPTIDEMQLPKVLKKLCLKERGMLLVTGVTGSGKSTTLAAMIEEINQNKKSSIITIEDPIEYLHHQGQSVISQREVGTDTESFKTALRYILRQDPDVVLIGEIRDQETIETALTAADTGHLVLSTLHTLDATETISRIVSFFPTHQHQQIRQLLASTLVGIVSQRLVPRTGEEGGRIAGVEILINTAAVKEYIIDMEKTLLIPQLIKEGHSQYGMQTFDQHLMMMYSKGVISYDEAMRNSTNPEEFRLRIQGITESSNTSWDSFDA